MFLTTPPASLQVEVERANEVGVRLMMTNQPGDAFEVFRRSYEQLLGSQPDGRRFHKGLPLHNMGWARFRSNLPEQGAHWTLLAFIEDALSRAEELPLILDELSRPAAQNLRLVGASEADLLDIAQSVRDRVARQVLVQDPTVLYLALDLPARIGRWIGAATAPAAPRIKVFVSSPAELRLERRLLAEICRQLNATLPATVEALLWEGAGPRNPECQSFPPAIMGTGAQAVIDDHIWGRLGGYDIYVGLLCRRMGTPTGPWRSGTEAEFRFAFDHRATAGMPGDILFYVKRAKPSASRHAETTAFVHELEGLGLVHHFDSKEDLRRAAFDHVSALVRARIARG